MSGSSEAVWGRLPPRLFFAPVSLEAALWSLELWLLWLAFWSEVVVVVVVEPWLGFDWLCEELALGLALVPLELLLVCATIIPTAKITTTSRSRIFLMFSPRVVSGLSRYPWLDLFGRRGVCPAKLKSRVAE
jgi:hypothetical protein